MKIKVSIPQEVNISFAINESGRGVIDAADPKVVEITDVIVLKNKKIGNFVSKLSILWTEYILLEAPLVVNEGLERATIRKFLQEVYGFLER